VLLVTTDERQKQKLLFITAKKNQYIQTPASTFGQLPHPYPLWPWLNVGSPGHVCLSHSSGVPPRRARRLGTALTGNFPQVFSGRGTQAYLCLCLLLCTLPISTYTLILCLPSHTRRDSQSLPHTAVSDIKPDPDVAILSQYHIFSIRSPPSSIKLHPVFYWH